MGHYDAEEERHSEKVRGEYRVVTPVIHDPVKKTIEFMQIEMAEMKRKISKLEEVVGNLCEYVAQKIDEDE